MHPGSAGRQVSPRMATYERLLKNDIMNEKNRNATDIIGMEMDGEMNE